MAKRNKAPSAGWSPDPLSALRGAKLCQDCYEVENHKPAWRTTDLGAFIECGGCRKSIHTACARQVYTWIFKLDPDTNGTTPVCSKCQARYENNQTWLEQNGLDSAGRNAKERFREFEAQREDRVQGNAWSYFKENDLDELDDARRAVKRVTDLVYTGQGAGAWRVIFDSPDIVPHADLALKQLHLPDIFLSPRAARMKKTAIMDILTGLALHEAGHGEYTTLDAARRIVHENWPEIGSTDNGHIWYYDGQTHRAYDDTYVNNHLTRYPGEAKRWVKKPRPSGDSTKRQHIQLMWNLVEDFYLEHKLRERFPGWDSYIHMAYTWMWAKAFDHLKETLASLKDPENSLTIRTTTAIWQILAPEKIEGKLNLPESLVLLADEARKLAVTRLLNGDLNTDDGKIRCALDLFTLLSNGCTFEQPKEPTCGYPGGDSNEPGGQPGKGTQGGEPGESQGRPSDPDGSESGKGTTSNESKDPEDEDSEPGNDEQGESPSEDNSERPGGSDQSDDRGSEGDKSDDGQVNHHTDDDGFDGSQRGEGDRNQEPGKESGKGAGLSGGEDVDKHRDDHLTKPKEIGPAKEDLSEQERKLLEAMLKGDGNVKEETQAKREESKTLKDNTIWDEDQKLTEHHKQAYSQRKQRLEHIINRLKKNLQLRNVQAEAKVGGFRSGRLNRRTLYRVVAANDDKVFYKRTQKNLPKVRIGLLIDESGSMGSVTNTRSPASIARDTGTILAEAFGGIRGLKLWVTGYSTGYKGNRAGDLIQSYVSPTRKKFEALEREIMGGGTPTGECMMKLAQVMSAGVSWDEQVIMFVVTDGGYGGLEPAQVQTMFPKVTFVEVLIGQGMAKQGLKYSIQVNNVSDFTNSMVKTISAILLGEASL
jgi:hypothetical protein